MAVIFSYNRPMDLVPLHVYSGFSFLASGLTVESYVKLGAKLGYHTLGLCDCLTLSGYAPFEKACNEYHLHPIFGMDAYVNGERFSLFIENEEGYSNLCELSFLSSEGKLTLNQIKEKTTGLACVYDLSSQPFMRSLKEGTPELLTETRLLLEKFSHMALGLPYLVDNDELALQVREFASNKNYRLLAFPHIVYGKKEDAIVLRIVNAIEKGEQLEIKEENGTAYFLSKEEAASFYSEDELLASESFASSLHFELKKKRGSLLRFPLENNLTSEVALRNKALKGLEEKNPGYSNQYLERLNYELSVITQMGYSDYFLIVSDYVDAAKKSGIIVGPGRGSAAGSLVSYALDIVKCDPIKYGLLFERFLNPERQSMPDIDVDFEDIYRDQIVEYLKKKYGRDRVAHVLTTIKIGAKQSIHDIARVYGYKDHEVSLLCSSITNDKLSLRQDYRTSPQFKKLVDNDPYYLQFVSLSSKIEGLPRQAGLHAAGVVLNEEPLDRVIPLRDLGNDGCVACLEKDYLEDQGFLKMDILGLRNLTIVDSCLSLIKAHEGISITYESLPYDDQNAINLIAKNMTMGLFQLESPGMKKTVELVAPTSFEEVADVLALFRPGPRDSIGHYARRKKGLERIDYFAPELESILKPTYGIIVYQEQIMQIASAIAGFSYAKADLFRRAISHKDALKLAALKGDFINGCLSKGHNQRLAETLYDLIYSFAEYGFNKSHAYSYAVLACQMAYLKFHHPKEFYASILNSMAVGEKKFVDTVSEAKKLGLHLALPNVNASKSYYEISGDSLLLPLGAVKGIPGTLIHGIVEERQLNGLYLDLFDFALRIKKHGLSLSSLVKLIDGGALDCLSPSRATLRANAGASISYANMMYGDKGDMALLDLGIEKPKLREEKDDVLVSLTAEKEALGLMVSGSPLDFWVDKIKEEGAISISEALETNGESFLACGVVKNVRVIMTKKGKQMAFLEVYDDLAEATFILWSEEYAEYFSILKEGKAILIRGRKDLRREDSFLGEEIKELK